MLNYIWFGLMAIALVVAAVRGTADAVTKGAVESAAGAVQIALGLVGIMTLWLGIMRVAEAAGLVALIGRLLRPVLRWLFPDVPAEHPAAGAIVLAIAANMLGLNNAATPLGIKAMESLQDLNPDKTTATNAMVTFSALTTSGVQLIPATMIGVLAAAGSVNPTAIIAPSILATAAGTVAAVVAARVLQRHRVGTGSLVSRSSARRSTAATRGRPMIRQALDAISLWAMPVLLVAIPLVGLIRGIKVYEVFIEGAKEGFEVSVKIIPFLVGILVAIGMFRGSGAMDLVTGALRAAGRRHAVSGGARAACDPALAEWERLAGVRDGSRQDPRRRLGAGPHGRSPLRIVGDHVLRAGGVFRRGRRAPDAARRAGRLDWRYRRRYRQRSGVYLALWGDGRAMTIAE